jgi:diguanylate cyclase
MWQKGDQCRLTVSIGVACNHQSRGTPESLLHAADLALYTAKRGGRNRVEVAAPVAPND